jgi:hypothetical protein
MRRADDFIMLAVAVLFAFCVGLLLGGKIAARKMEAGYAEGLFLERGDVQARYERGVPRLSDSAAACERCHEERR